MSNLASLNVKIDRSVKKESDSAPFKIHIIENEAAKFHQLIDIIRTENEAKGFLTDDEINAEIKAYRNEKQGTQA